MNRLIGVVFLIAGLAVVATGFFVKQDFEQKAAIYTASTSGTVVKSHESSRLDCSGDDGCETEYSCSLTVEYTIDNGENRSLSQRESGRCKSNTARTVFYNPENSADVTLSDYSSTGSKMIPYFVMGVGGVFVIVSLTTIFRRNNQT